MKRRDVLKLSLGTMAGAALSGFGGSKRTRRRPMTKPRMPVVYLPHGGGPWPFVELPMFDRGEVTALAEYLRTLEQQLGARPKAVLVISAHWEEPVPTLMTAARPPLYYDYYGFPEESYRITWPAPGAPQLAERVKELLTAAGLPAAVNAERGFDHGTFIPLKLTFPNADIPTLQLSLMRGLDPAAHIALGRVLAPLRDEGVLIVGSGMSYHNMRGFGTTAGRSVSELFDAWLRETATAEPKPRDERLAQWESAPAARQAHPREEHLMPLMVIAGAAGADRGKVGFDGSFGNVRLSAFHYG